MALKVFINLVIIASVFHEFNLQTVPITDPCDISTIIREHSDLLDEKVRNSNLVIQQNLADAKDKSTQSSEPLDLQKFLSGVKATLDNLTQDLCTKSIQAEFEYKTLKINALLLKCNASSNNYEAALQAKTESALNKINTIKAKSALALQKCGINNGLIDCSVIRTFCQQVVLAAINKIDSKTNETVNSLSKIAVKQNNCLRKVAREALEIENDIKEELLECRLQGFSPDAISSESVESNESKSDTSAKENQSTPAPAASNASDVERSSESDESEKHPKKEESLVEKEESSNETNEISNRV